VAAGTPVERLSQLSDCYKKVNHTYSLRYLMPHRHVLTEELAGPAPAPLPEAGQDERQQSQGKKALRAALDYIEKNYTQATLNLNEVANAIGVSPNYFSGMFSQEMDMTFVEYVTNKRMEQAKRLLAEQQLSSAETAAAVGYKDAHYFSSVFKKAVGMSPREWRSRPQ
jgi:two-component system response regulator YesN